MRTTKPQYFQLDFAQERDIGNRANQEDYGQFLQMDAPADTCQDLVFTLADGMGGLAGGEVASKLVVNAFLRALKNEGPASRADVQSSMLRCMKAADAALGKRKQLEGEELATMGCTLCCVRVVDGRFLHFLSVGDSLIYLIRGYELWRLNDLHNYREDMRRMAQQEGLDWNSIANSPEVVKHGSRITSYMYGSEEGIQQVHCPATPIELQEGDCVLVASDGLLTLTPREIVQTVRSAQHYESAENIVSDLIDNVLSKKKTHQDNVSVGLIQLIRVPSPSSHF